MQLQSFSHLENMVSKPTWKDILLELMSSEKIDPWNIDISELADAFIKKVREIEAMDFALQANVILAASILLKYKSNYLKLLRYQSDLSDFDSAEFVPDESGVAIEELPELTFSSRIPPKRQITADELIQEMEKLIKFDNIDRVIIPRGSIVETVDLELYQRDIEKDMETTLKKVVASTDSEGWSLFSKITAGADFRDIVYTLLCLLHMVQAGVIDIRQDEIFGEIFIHLMEKKKNLE